MSERTVDAICGRYVEEFAALDPDHYHLRPHRAAARSPTARSRSAAGASAYGAGGVGSWIEATTDGAIDDGWIEDGVARPAAEPTRAPQPTSRTTPVAAAARRALRRTRRRPMDDHPETDAMRHCPTTLRLSGGRP